jgi:hypothetical protein
VESKKGGGNLPERLGNIFGRISERVRIPLSPPGLHFDEKDEKANNAPQMCVNHGVLVKKKSRGEAVCVVDLRRKATVTVKAQI